MGKAKTRGVVEAPKGAPLPDDDWVQFAAQPKRRCSVCNDAAYESIRSVMRLINEKQAWSIPLDKIYQRVCELNSGFGERVRIHNFRAHLDGHEPLWHRYKGEPKGAKS